MKKMALLSFPRAHSPYVCMSKTSDKFQDRGVLQITPKTAKDVKNR